MNTIKKIQLTLIAAMVLFTMNSCVKDDDWSLPPNNCSDEWQTDLMMADLFTMVNEANGALLSFDEERIIEGYVVSSDSTGNFFKTVSIQNDLNNPTYGLQVEMDRTNLFNNFPNGSKIKINLKGLNVGYDRGVLKVGENYVDAGGNTRVGRMAEFKIDGHVARTCDGIEMATPVVFNNLEEFFNNSVFNTLVTIKNIQFDDSELGTTYGDAVGSQTLDKKLIDNTGKTLKLRNSGYASFAGDLIPEGSGSITVVVSAFTHNPAPSPSDYQVYIRDTNDVQFNNPRFGDGGGTSGEFLSCLVEDFTSYSVENESFPKYENLAVTGARKWRVTDFGGNKYIQVSAFNAGSAVVSYFVVPVNFSEADTFSFKTKDGYYTGDPLKVYYSTNYVPGGNINNATLVDITNSFTISSGSTNGYAPDFTDSGDYSLASLSGNGVIVFAYEGSGSGVTTTMQIDDIKIIDNDDPNCGGGNGGGDPEPPSGDAVPLFAGHDFENWSAFIGGLNSFGIKSYATQGAGAGMNGSASLNIFTDPTTTNGNDYVFTTLATAGLPTSYSKISFYVKGSSTKSVSLNVYKNDGTYYVYNLGSLTGSTTLTSVETNQYTGTINTGGDWALVTLDLTGISDLNVSNTTASLFALKVGKNADYNLNFDNFTIE